MAFDAKKYMLEHGEKVVLGVVSTLSLLLLVFAFLRGSLPDTLSGDKLKSAADAKLAAVKAGTQIEDTAQLNAPPADIVLKKMDYKDVKEGEDFKFAYDFALKPWVNPVIRLKVARPEPRYLAVRDLRVTIGRGHLAYKGSGGAAAAPAGAPPNPKGFQAPPGSLGRAKHYAVITGLVPVADQRRRYEDTFTDTLAPEGYDGKQDKPEYYRYVIERAEVQPGTADGDLQWTALNELDDVKTTDQVRDPALAKRFAEEWAGIIPDKTPLPFIEWCMVYVNPAPSEEGAAKDAARVEGEGDENARWLPPRVLYDWMEHEINHPEIIKALAQAHPSAPAADGAKPKPKEATEEDPAEAFKKLAQAYPFRLLRAFDFDVQAGKQYKYRVTLVLRNPNRGIEVRFLDHGDAKLAEGKFRRSAATISPVVMVPLDGGLLAGEVSPAPRTGTLVREPRLKVLVMGIEATSEALKAFQDIIDRAPKREQDKLKEEFVAMQAMWTSVDRVFPAREVDAVRGSWMTFSGVAQILHPILNAPADLKQVMFRGDTLVCDFGLGVVMAAKEGGKPAVVDSGDVLLLDGAGRLLIRNRYDDAFHYTKHQPPAAGADAKEMASAPSMTAEQLRDLQKPPKR